MTKPAPYSPDIRAKGWRFELDHERIRQSDTWALAPAEIKPWLLMLWMTAWEQAPCGSLPAADQLIAARIGMPMKTFAKHRDCLMRGWWEADDGRLYHDALVERVVEMQARKDKEKTRKAEYRRRMSEGKTPVSHGTTTGQTGDGHGSPPGCDATGTGTGTGTNTDPVPIGTGGAAAKVPADMTKDELWKAGKSLLSESGIPAAQCGSIVGKLVKDYGDAIVVDAVRSAVVTRPADPVEYLKATCMRSAGQRTKPGKHSGFQTLNYHEGVSADGSLA